MRALTSTVAAIAVAGCFAGGAEAPLEEVGGFPIEEKVVKSDAEWQRLLDYRAYQTLRWKVTEWPYTGDLWDLDEDGVYRCAGCGLPLFSSRAKYDSGTGWPSFLEPVKDANIYTRPDHTAGAVRTEVLCSRCDGHLGHRFADGPEPTGLRYCINSSALAFDPTEEGGGVGEEPE